MQKNQGTPQLGLELALLTCIEQHRVAQTAPTQGLPVAQTQVPVRIQQSVQSQEPQRAVSSATPVVRPEPVARKEQEAEPLLPPVVKQPTPPTVHTDVSDSLPDWDDVSFSDEDEVEEIAAPPARPTLSLVPPQEKQAETVAEEAVTHEDENDGPILTVAEIKEKWELIKRRIKTRKDGSKI